MIEISLSFSVKIGYLSPITLDSAVIVLFTLKEGHNPVSCRIHLLPRLGDNSLFGYKREITPPSADSTFPANFGGSINLPQEGPYSLPPLNPPFPPPGR